MWRCAGNVSAHFTSSMASASRAQCLLFLFLSLRAAQWPHLLFVCNSHITYCMQGRIQSPLHSVDFGPQCCCCCFSSFLLAPTLGKAKIPVVKSPVALPSEIPRGVSFVGCACTAEVGSEGVLFSWVSSHQGRGSAAKPCCVRAWLAEAEQIRFSHFIMSGLGWSHKQCSSFVLASRQH